MGGLLARAGGGGLPVSASWSVLLSYSLLYAFPEIVSCQGDPWQLGVTLTWRRCQGQSGLDNVGGQSMQAACGMAGLPAFG